MDGGLMADRLIYSDTHKRIYVVTEGIDDTPQVERYEWTDPKDDRLAKAVDVLNGWADQMDDYEVTQGNAVQTVQRLVDRSAVFYRHFADLLDKR